MQKKGLCARTIIPRGEGLFATDLSEGGLKARSGHTHENSTSNQVIVFFWILDQLFHGNAASFGAGVLDEEFQVGQIRDVLVPCCVHFSSMEDVYVFLVA